MFRLCLRQRYPAECNRHRWYFRLRIWLVNHFHIPAPALKIFLPSQALNMIFFAGESRKRAEQEYLEKYFGKVVDLHYIDQSRRSMHKDLRANYEKNLSWASSLGIGRERPLRSSLISADHTN